MAQQGICLRLGMSPEAALQWWREGELRPRMSDSPQELAGECAGEAVYLVAPAAQMLTLEAQMPAMPSQRMRQALPYALEEQIAGDVEQMHFAHGSRSSEGVVPVVAVEHERMREWLQLCDEAQLRPQGLYNDALSLPWREGSWTLLLESDGGLLRTGQYSGYALDAEQWPSLLALGWEGRDAAVVDTLVVLDAREDGEGPALPSLIDANIEHEHCEYPLRQLCQGREGNPVNLLQGKYSRREKAGRLWAPWRATAALLGLFLGIHLAWAVYDYLKLSSQDEALYGETVALFRQTFPEVQNIANPRVQMERELTALRTGGTASAFATLMGRTGEALGESSGVSLRGLRYRQGQLELELELDSLPQLDGLRARLESHPLAVEVRNASSQGDKVEASIVVSEAGA